MTAFCKNTCTDKKRACNTHPCTEWSEWTSSKCSVTCGLGTNMFSRTCNPICNRKRILGEFEIKPPTLNGSCAPGKSETEYEECSIMSTCQTEESSTVEINDMDTAELKRKWRMWRT